MKVTYIIEDLKLRLKSGLSPNEKKYYERWSILPDKFYLTHGKSYTIYGIEFTKEGFSNFILIDDTEVTNLNFFPSEFFEIIDNRISKYWVGTQCSSYPLNDIIPPTTISFKEIETNEFFLGNLLNGESDSQQIFLKYKNMIENEFPDEDLKTAEVIGGNWVSCNYCGEVWEIKSNDGIIVCPKNFERNNNPFWR